MAKKKGSEAAPPAGGYAAFREYTRQLREHQFNELTEQVRRTGAAARNRRQMLEALARKAGTDLAAFDTLHDKEWESILKWGKSQEKAILTVMNQQRERQQQALRTIVAHKDRFEYKKGNPHTSICLWRAIQAPTIDVIPQTFNDGVVRILSDPPNAPPPNEGFDNIRVSPVPVRVGENIVREAVSVIANAPHGFHFTPAAAVDISTEHVFETRVPHDGVLSVTGNYAPLGNIFLGAPGDCISPGGAQAEINLFVFVTVTTAGGDRIDVPLGSNIVKVFDHSVDATCDGKSRSIPFSGVNGSAFQLSQPNIIAVQAGDTVRVRAGFEIFMEAALSGATQANFAPRPFGLNVPMVLLRIDS